MGKMSPKRFCKKLSELIQEDLDWRKRIQSTPGIVFTPEQEKVIRDLVVQGELNQAQKIIIEKMTKSKG